MLLTQEDQTTMKKGYDIDLIAKAIVMWGMSEEFDDIIEVGDENALENEKYILQTVINFLIIFEYEFELIFSAHCKANMSEEQVTNFVNTRCSLLGELKGYFGYILPCTFMREVAYRFKNHFKCSHVFSLLVECLKKFLEDKFNDLESGSSFDGFLTYCKNIHTQFKEKCLYKDNEDLFKEDLEEEPMHIENADTIVQSNEEITANGLFKCCAEPNDIFGKQVTLDFDRTDDTNMSLYTNNRNCSLDVASRETPYSIPELSKSITRVCFDDEKKQHEIEEKNAINSLFLPDISSNEVSDIQECEELAEICYILMPNKEFAAEVYHVVQKCFFLGDSNNGSLQVDKGSACEPANHDGY